MRSIGAVATNIVHRVCVGTASGGGTGRLHGSPEVFSRDGGSYGKRHSVRAVATNMFHRVRVGTAFETLNMSGTGTSRDAVRGVPTIYANIHRTKSGRALREAGVAWDAESVRRLCESAIRTDTCTPGMREVFTNATRAWDRKTARTLLESGLDVNEPDSEGNRPLGLAVRTVGGCLDIVKELLRRGAGINGRDAKGRTPLAIVVEEGTRLHFMEELLRWGADVNIPDAEGRTPFAIAVESGCLMAVEALLAHGGVDIDTRDREGRTPLTLVSRGDDAGRIHDLIVEYALTRYEIGRCEMWLVQLAMYADPARLTLLIRGKIDARWMARACEIALFHAVAGLEQCKNQPERACRYRQIIKILENARDTLNRDRIASDPPVVANSPV
ncbi:MAG: ankyrin repeat domain-containing protein [Simkaniaceae bacterium]|nr:ankyrin repeat domain-containing protein [Simkaniaceae bacterium]